jgi:hypothetical protein
MRLTICELLIEDCNTLGTRNAVAQDTHPEDLETPSAFGQSSICWLDFQPHAVGLM